MELSEDERREHVTGDGGNAAHDIVGHRLARHAVNRGQIAELSELLCIREPFQDVEICDAVGGIIGFRERAGEGGVVRVLVIDIVKDGVCVDIAPRIRDEHVAQKGLSNSFIDTSGCVLRRIELRGIGICCGGGVESRTIKVGREIDKVRVEAADGIDLSVLVALKRALDL